MTILKEFLFVGLGGFIGAASRYGVNVLCALYLTKSPLPLGTLAVNVTGAFLIGFLSVFLADGQNHIKLFFIAGILGGFTTFSAFSHETMVLINNSQPLHAAANILLNVILCLIFVFAGIKAARLI